MNDNKQTKVPYAGIRLDEKVIRAVVIACGMALCFLFSVPAEAAGTTYYIKDGTSNWTDGGNYWNGSCPGEDDIVVISNKSTVTVRSDDAASWNLVSRLRSIRPLYNQSKIVFDVAKDLELTNNAAVFNPEGSINGFWGEMEKTGEGTLVLGSSNRHLSANACYDYKVGTITVSEGTLKFPQNTPKRELQYGNLHVAKDATAVLTVFDTSTGGSTMMYCVNGTLTGGGAIVNGNPGTRQFRVYKASEFSGRFTGHTQLYICGQLDLTGADSTMDGSAQVWSLADSAPGSIGVKRFGMKSDTSSSIGVNGTLTIDYRGGGFKYLGEGGETTDKELVISATTVNPATMDGGANGGLTFTGKWHMNGTPNQMHTLLLKGENRTACVLANDIADWRSSGGTDYAFQIVKYGSGTWRFADCSARTWSGTLNVREGTVQFDSLSPAGELCSLGYATTLSLPYMGAYDASKKVDYAISLGGPDESGRPSAGTLEYLGSGRAMSNTRPVVLDGLGGTIKGSTTGELSVSGVSATGVGERLLTLDAAAGTTNYLENLDERDSRISLVKTGAGTWVLQGRQVASGDLTVSNGTLVVRSIPAQYTYFRFTAKRVTGGGDRLNAVELALYDEAGAQQLYDPVRVEPVPFSSNTWVWCNGDCRSLQPGQVSFAKPGWYKCTWYSPSDFRDLRVLFNRWAAASQPSTEIFYGGSGATAAGANLKPENPETWITIAMRLPQNAKRVVAYDIMASSTYGRQWRPGTFLLEGSRDGIFWTKLHEVVGGAGVIGGGDSSSGEYQWMSDGSTTSWTSSSQNKRPGCGWSLDTDLEQDGPQLANLGKVEVAAGARLVGTGEQVVSSLHIDAAGAGNIENFRFGESGTLEVANCPNTEGMFELGLAFVNADGLDNIKGWTLEGANTGGRRIVVKHGRLYLVPRGLVLNFK